MTMAQAKQGDLVRIHYTGRLTDGTVFDSSREREPLEFHAGGTELIPGVSHAVVGMTVGETRTVEVPPAEGYGDRREDLMQQVPRDALPPEVKVGEPLSAQAGDQVINVWVTELGEEHAVVDANHPLAGKTLEFELELVAIQDAEA
jgi:peptidylprolyl isomerase